jgi:N-acetylneuraminate synthase
MLRRTSPPINRDVFDELFVLELANNHWGKLERGIRIVREFGTVARYNNVRAAIKLQIRDVDSFVHKDFRTRTDIRYVKKTIETQLSRDDLRTLVEEIRKNNCIPMATPFDEASVETCVDLEMPILKIASSDLNDWVLIEKIASTRLPAIASTGGSSLKDIDDLVTFFANRGLPLALNHCVSIYPSEDSELEMNQIDFLRERYPSTTIGFSTHEHTDWATTIMIAYAKGARTFERHIDIEEPGYSFAPYCSTPDQIDEWFRAYKRAQVICGAPGTARRFIPEKEIQYLDNLVRGVYAKRDLPAGHVLTDRDVYLAIPLQKGQTSCRELISGSVLSGPVAKDGPLRLEDLENAYGMHPDLRALIAQRGL